MSASSFIPYGRQEITEQDVAQVVAVLGSDFLTQGPKVPEFEASVKNATNAAYAVASNSATSSLHIACLALDVGPGDRVWTSPVSFVASSNCALYCGAEIDFVDIDPATRNMSVEALEEKLIDAEAKGQLPKVVIPVHLCGQSCDMQKIHALGQKYGFSIIEDASHAIGGRYLDQPVGDCRFSDICVFSFHPVKIVTTAEGGVATTQNPDLATKMDMLRSHGITRDPNLMTQAPDGPWYYQQIMLGLNYRMTELQAALGCSQMERLHDFVSRRHILADRYDERLADLPLITPAHDPKSYSALHLYVVQLQGENPNHLEVFNGLRERQIGVNLHYIPIHMQPYYRQLGFKDGMFPNAEDYYKRSISIPIFHAMDFEQQDRVVAALTEIVTA